MASTSQSPCTPVPPSPPAASGSRDPYLDRPVKETARALRAFHQLNQYTLRGQLGTNLICASASAAADWAWADDTCVQQGYWSAVAHFMDAL